MTTGTAALEAAEHRRPTLDQRLADLPIPVLVGLAAAVAAASVAGWFAGRTIDVLVPTIPLLVALSAGLTPFGVFVMRRIPGHPIGRLMVLGGASAMVATAAYLWSASPVGGWLSQWAWWPPYAVVPLLLLVVPDGRLPSRRWRPLAALLVGSGGVVAAALATAGLLQPGGVLLTPDAPVLPAAAVLVGVALVALGLYALASMGVLVALTLRWRRAEHQERRQLACLLPVPVMVVVGLALQAVAVPFGWIPAAVALPLALTVAVLRYQLHNLDLYIHRGAVWLALTAIAVFVYAVAVAGFGAVLAVPGQPLASILAAAAVAARLQPAQWAVRRGVGRMLYGRRDEPYSMITELGRHLGTLRDPLATLPEIAATIVEGLVVPYAAVRVVGEDGEVVTVAERGRWVGEPQRFPMIAHGRAVGDLLVAPRRPGTSFAAGEAGLLTDLAGQAGLAAEACRSALALRQARDRLVFAREEERRRLRRDLHDGVASALVGTRMVADVARRTAVPGGSVPELLDTITGDLDACLVEVRGLIDGLRPAVLDDGLGSALRELTGRFSGADGEHGGPTVELDVGADLDGLPAAVEVAAYRVVGEALTNITKHASARHASVVVHRTERHLELHVRDDGRGISAAGTADHEGVGLASMRGRVEELGGHCEIGSGPDGTTVTVQLPLTA